MHPQNRSDVLPNASTAKVRESISPLRQCRIPIIQTFVPVVLWALLAQYVPETYWALLFFTCHAIVNAYGLRLAYVTRTDAIFMHSRKDAEIEDSVAADYLFGCMMSMTLLAAGAVATATKYDVSFSQAYAVIVIFPSIRTASFICKFWKVRSDDLRFSFWVGSALHVIIVGNVVGFYL